VEGGRVLGSVEGGCRSGAVEGGRVLGSVEGGCRSGAVEGGRRSRMLGAVEGGRRPRMLGAVEGGRVGGGGAVWRDGRGGCLEWRVRG